MTNGGFYTLVDQVVEDIPVSVTHRNSFWAILQHGQHREWFWIRVERRGRSVLNSPTMIIRTYVKSCSKT